MMDPLYTTAYVVMVCRDFSKYIHCYLLPFFNVLKCSLYFVAQRLNQDGLYYDIMRMNMTQLFALN